MRHWHSSGVQPCWCCWRLLPHIQGLKKLLERRTSCWRHLGKSPDRASLCRRPIRCSLASGKQADDSPHTQMRQHRWKLPDRHATERLEASPSLRAASVLGTIGAVTIEAPPCAVARAPFAVVAMETLSRSSAQLHDVLSPLAPRPTRRPPNDANETWLTRCGGRNGIREL